MGLRFCISAAHPAAAVSDCARRSKTVMHKPRQESLAWVSGRYWTEVPALGKDKDVGLPWRAVLSRNPQPGSCPPGPPPCSAPDPLATCPSTPSICLQHLVPEGRQLTLCLDTELAVRVTEPTSSVLRASQRSSRHWESPLSLQPARPEAQHRPGSATPASKDWAPCPKPAGHTGVSGHQCESYTPGYCCLTRRMPHN